MWNRGDQVALRGMYNGKPWYVQSVLVVKDSLEETALLLTPGAECVAPWGYIHQKHGNNGEWKRWDECLNEPWRLETYRWHTNRFLILLEPDKFYSTILVWNDASSQFLCYYINFQLPFTRSQCGFDTFDLELDMVIEPTFQWKWKDVNEYREGIRMGVLREEWIEDIENAKPEILAAIEQRSYPLNGDWLDWQPDPAWSAPNLPQGWDQETPMPDAQKKKVPPTRLVCGRTMTTAPENYYPAEYQGRIIYFCTEFCLDAFKADPDRFYSAHSKSAKNASSN